MEITENISMKEYHARAEVSSSQVAAFEDDPIKYYHQFIAKDWPRDPGTSSQDFGTSVHEMIEHEDPDSICKTIPSSVLNSAGHRRGKAYTNWIAENPAQSYIKEGEINPFPIIWEHLNQNETVRPWLYETNKEVTVIWKHEPSGLDCRCRLDCVTDNEIIDWKTARDVSPRKFQRDICDLNYDLRLAFYQYAWEAQTGKLLPVKFVAIQNSPGYSVVPYKMSAAWMSQARNRLDQILVDMANLDIDQYKNQGQVEMFKPDWRFSDPDEEVIYVAD